jgi:hypothetical protein
MQVRKIKYFVLALFLAASGSVFIQALVAFLKTL